MKVLMISTDRKIFEEGSAVRARMIEYGKLFEELHIIVFAKGSKFYSEKLSENTQAFPTNSRNKLSCVFDAIKIGKKVMKNLGSDGTVISCQDPFETGLVGWRLARKFNVKLQLQIHTDIFSPYFMNHSFLNRIRVLIASFLLPKAHTVRVVSSRIESSLVVRGYPREKISVLPIFVDTEKFKKDSEFDLHDRYRFKTIVLMVSRIEREKNVAEAIEIFESVAADYSDAGLVIVGDGGEKAVLVKKVKGHGLSERIFFEPWQGDLIPYYKSADIFLSTSFYEGYGLTLIEAALCGLPIVTSDIGVVPEVIKNDVHALVCPVGDRSCFTKALGRLISDTELQNRLGEAGKRVEERLMTKEQFSVLYKQSFTKAFAP